MSEKVRFWGVRGSIPAPGPDTVRYGGNTSCVEVRMGGKVMILDSGTGIRMLGNSLMAEFKNEPIEGHIFIGHTHWDHIQGFPFFVPAYVPRNTFTIYSAHGVGRGFEKIFREQMNQNYFPVETGDMAAKISFEHVNGTFQVGDVKVETTFSNHPGVNLAFRFSHGGKSLVYLTDHENYQAQVQGVDDFSVKQDRIIENFCRGADLLICDAQYTDEDYKQKRGWGHSRWKDTVALGLGAGVKALALFHHEPLRSDDEIDRIVGDCQSVVKEKGSSMRCFAAREREEIEL